MFSKGTCMVGTDHAGEALDSVFVPTAPRFFKCFEGTCMVGADHAGAYQR